MSRLKLGVVVGHNIKSQGAVRRDTGETEFSYNSRLAEMIVSMGKDTNIDVKVFIRTAGLGYTREIRKVYKEVDAWGADLSMELHFNSAAATSAGGTETLSSGSKNSLIFAEEIQEQLLLTMGSRNRGVKVRNSRTKGRGYMSLISGRAPAVIIEPFFGSNPADLKATDQESEMEEIARALVYATMDAEKRI
jgi:N-acetylmuramoyl-L-alanine amidase